MGQGLRNGNVVEFGITKGNNERHGHGQPGGTRSGRTFPGLPGVAARRQEDRAAPPPAGPATQPFAPAPSPPLGITSLAQKKS
ncbi:hypothetical protein ACFYXM_36955 [Streptomyces sp. NPDC002476]|uniref:hypothetical protein n=1 Tax=Streptomyces sp. NPDC002476 TaxID=3364648 RepID=UPI00367BF473